MTQKELEQLFSQYGRIITSRILVDQVTGEESTLVLHFLSLPNTSSIPSPWCPRLKGECGV